MSELKPCPFCGGGETQTAEARLSPRMDGPGALIGVTIRHFCGGLGNGAQRLTIQAHGRDHVDAIAVWNRRIAALPQPITAETVRRVLDAMGGLIGSGAKPDDWLDHEAIAQRANDEIKNG